MMVECGTLVVSNSYHDMLSGDKDKDVEPSSEESGEEDDENDDDADGDKPARVIRSAYVGRGNVQAVREARKRASPSDTFPRDDPLLSEFAAFLRASRAAPNDVNNKTGQASKLLHYLSTRYSLQSKVK